MRLFQLKWECKSTKDKIEESEFTKDNQNKINIMKKLVTDRIMKKKSYFFKIFVNCARLIFLLGLLGF